MQDMNMTSGNLLPNEMEVNLDVLGALMLNRVGRHVDSANVVTIDQSSSPKGGMELEQELTQPRGLSNTVGHRAVLSFNTGSGDCILTLGGPGDEIITEEYGVDRGGLARVRATSPISVSVDHKISGRRWPQ